MHSFFRNSRSPALFSVVNGFCGLFTLLFASSAQAQKSSEPSERAVFVECLKEYKNFKNEAINDVVVEAEDFRSYERLDEKVLNALTEGQLKSRFSKYNRDFQALKNIYSKISKISVEQKNKLLAMPLTTKNEERTKKELVVQAIESNLRQSRMKLIIKSFECNKSIVDLVAQQPQGSKVLLAAEAPREEAKVAEKKTTPGKFGGARKDREKLSDGDRLNLTPVDAEFYSTQLGKKLKRDLGGMVDYWSYDYQRDELYVQVGDEVAKIGVVTDSGGSRIIKTRIGPRFEGVKAPDEKVDNLAEGRFLTGDKNQETLFGKMPSKKPSLVDEKDPQTHEGHDH